MTTHPGRTSGPRRALSVAVALLLSLLVVSAAPSVASADGGLAVTSTTTTTAQASATTPLRGVTVTGIADSATTLQLTVATDRGTLAVSTTTGLTLAYGNAWSGTASITATGTQADLDTALATLALTTGADSGKTAAISVTALVSTPGYVLSPTNEHFYEYVASKGVSWTAARAAALQRTFLGQTGYLATIPSQDVNDLVSTRIQGATNVWFGARSTDTPTATPARTWSWADGPLAGTVVTSCGSFLGTCNFTPASGQYTSWKTGEPNNTNGRTGVAGSGEGYAVINYGGVGKWNDFSNTNTSISGYVVEYGDQVNGASSFPGVVTASSNVAIVSAPGAPTGVSAARGNGSATVSFTPPAFVGSSPITGYTLTVAPDGRTVACSASPCVVTGLTNGTAYTVTVHATNAVGDSPESSPASTVTPATLPGAPTGVSATPGNRSASVAFTAPADNGGSPVTRYTVTAGPGGLTASCTSSPCVVPGLTNGTAYTFSVVATNGVGDSPASDTTTATPVSVPAAPTGVSATRGDGSATVSFTAPTDTGGRPLTGYRVTVSPGGSTVSCDASPCLVKGLTNGTAYTFTVAATNGTGTSLESAKTSTVTPATLPGAPTGVSATPGNRSATVAFTAPAGNGGSPVTGYTVTAGPGGLTATCTSSPCLVTGLTNGTEYTFSVVASNDVGDSPASDTTTATPLAVPAAPTGVSAARGNGSATVSFTAPTDDGGSTVTGYRVTVSPGGAFATCRTSPCLVPGLTNGTDYTFTVAAVNALGLSEESDPTDAVTPATVPGAPSDLTVDRGDGSVALTFSAPGSDGGSAVTRYQVSLDGGDTWQPLRVTDSDPLTATVDGLTNGTKYAVQVRAVNAIGAGPATEANGVTPARKPSTVGEVTATRGDGKATVAFAAPADNGSAITGYTVTSAPDGIEVTCTESPCVVDGLDNGTRYTFTVVATNDVGDSSDSDPSNSVVPAAKPTAPSLDKVVSAAGALLLTLDAPEHDGGSAVLGYQVSTDGGDTWEPLTVAESEPLTATVTGLDNGTTYGVLVRAVNSVGNGSASVSLEGTPATVPDAPRAVGVSVTSGQATVSWTAPSSDGGSPVTSYVVTAGPGDQTCTTTTTSCTFADLPTGVTYTFSVVAVNLADDMTGTGTGPAATSAPTTVTTVPGVPRSLAATPGDRTLTLTFAPPADDGGSPVTGYQVSTDGGATWRTVTTSGTSSLTVTLAPVLDGDSFAVQVRARNADGTGPATATVTARTPTWFTDPVSPADRKKEVKVPTAPTKYHGPLASTTALDRSHDGTVAYPANGLEGRQLQPGQAVNLDTLFEFDSAALSPVGLAEVKAAAASMRYVSAVTCEGYADYGASKKREKKLSKKRATAVCSALQTYAPQVASRTVKAYGSTRPVVIGGQPADRAANRRVVVLVRQ